MHIYYLVHFFKANVNIFDFVDEVLFQSLQKKKKMKIIKFPIIFYKSKSLHNSNKYEYYIYIHLVSKRSEHSLFCKINTK